MAFQVVCPSCGGKNRFAERPSKSSIRCRDCEEVIELDIEEKPKSRSTTSPRKGGLMDEAAEELPRNRRSRNDDDGEDRPRRRRADDDDDDDRPRRGRPNRTDDDDDDRPVKSSGGTGVMIAVLIGLGVVVVGAVIGLIVVFLPKGDKNQNVAVNNAPVNIPVGENPFGNGPPPVGPPGMDNGPDRGNPGRGNPARGNPGRAPFNPQGGAANGKPWQAGADPSKTPPVKPGTWSAPIKNTDSLFVPDNNGKCVAIGFQGGLTQTRLVYDIETGNQIGFFTGDLTGFDKFFSLSDQGDYLLSTFMNKCKVLQRDKANALVTLNGHIDWAVFSPDSKYIYAAEMRNFKHYIRRYSIDGQMLQEFPREVDGFMQGKGAISPGGKYLVVREKSALSVFEAATGNYLGSIPNPVNGPFPSDCKAVRYMPDGTRLVAVYGESVRILDATNGKILKDFPHKSRDEIAHIGISNDGKRISFGKKMYDLEGKEVKSNVDTVTFGPSSLPKIVGDSVFCIQGNLGNTTLHCQPLMNEND